MAEWERNHTIRSYGRAQAKDGFVPNHRSRQSVANFCFGRIMSGSANTKKDTMRQGVTLHYLAITTADDELP
jgi:hypothetical protein